MDPKAGGVQLVRIFLSQHVWGVKAEPVRSRVNAFDFGKAKQRRVSLGNRRAV